MALDTPPHERKWTTDQALIWIATKDFDACERVSREHGPNRTHWVAYRLGDLDTAVLDGAERDLLRALQFERVKATIADQPLTADWLGAARWRQNMDSDDAPSMELVSQLERPEVLAEFGDGTRFKTRGSEAFTPRLEAVDVVAAFPASQRPQGPKLVISNEAQESDRAEIAAQMTPTQHAIEDAIQAIWNGTIPASIRADERNEAIGRWIVASGKRPNGPDRSTITAYLNIRGNKK